MTNEQKDELEVAETLGVQDSYQRTTRVRRWFAVAAGLIAMISLMAWVRSDSDTVTITVNTPLDDGDDDDGGGGGGGGGCFVNILGF